MAPRPSNRYDAVIEKIFFDHYEEGLTEFEFDREEMTEAARALGIDPPANLGDVLYAYRNGRQALPSRIQATAPGEHWTIPGAGRSRYKFRRRAEVALTPNELLTTTKIPESTPGVIKMYAQGDEQALLARLRYNRLVDIFTGVTCYSLQNHLRTTVSGVGQVETDELYVGMDHRGQHYIIPVQAKGENEHLGTVQIEQDLLLCAEKYPDLVCRAIGAQFMAEEVIAMFELTTTEEGIRLVGERHYQLVPPDELSEEELRSYQEATNGG